MRTFTITTDYGDLEVEGPYKEAEKGDMDTPGSPSSFEVENVYHNGVDVTEIFDAIDDAVDIRQDILEKLNY